MNRILPRPRPQELHVEVQWLLRPVSPCEMVPAGWPGLLNIETEKGAGTCYMVTRLEVRGVLTGHRLTKADGTTYDLPADLSSCECKDFAYRGQHRPGGCKHTQGVRQALRQLEAPDEWDEAETRWQPTAAAKAAEADLIDLDNQPHAGCRCRSAAEHAASCPPPVLTYDPQWWDDGGQFDPAA